MEVVSEKGVNGRTVDLLAELAEERRQKGAAQRQLAAATIKAATLQNEVARLQQRVLALEEENSLLRTRPPVNPSTPVGGVHGTIPGVSSATADPLPAPPAKAVAATLTSAEAPLSTTTEPKPEGTTTPPAPAIPNSTDVLAAESPVSDPLNPPPIPKTEKDKNTQPPLHPALQVTRSIILAAQGSSVDTVWLSELLDMKHTDYLNLLRSAAGFRCNEKQYVVRMKSAKEGASDPEDGAVQDTSVWLEPLLTVLRASFENMRVARAPVLYGTILSRARWEERFPALAAQATFPRFLHHFESLVHNPRTNTCRFHAPSPSTKNGEHCESPLSQPSPPPDVPESIPGTPPSDAPNPDLDGIPPSGEPYYEWVYREAVSSLGRLPPVPWPVTAPPPAIAGLSFQQVGEHVRALVATLTPTDRDVKARSSLRLRLQTALCNSLVFKGDGAGPKVQPVLYLYGSNATNTFSRNADLDTCLVCAKDYNSHLSRTEVQGLVVQIYTILKHERTVHGRLVKITHANVPILKKESPEAFDISFNFSGVRNSALLRAYVTADSIVQPLAMAVNAWSKRAKINDGPSGLLNSYTVLLMVIYYLLRADEINFIPIDTSLELVPEPPYTKPDIPESSLERLGRLVVGFFHFYARQFPWDLHVVCLRVRTLLTRHDKGWHHAPLAVEDPFETHLNTARNVHEAQGRWVRANFLQAWEMLQAGQLPNLPSLGAIKPPQAEHDAFDESASPVPEGGVDSAPRDKASEQSTAPPPSSTTLPPESAASHHPSFTPQSAPPLAPTGFSDPAVLALSILNMTSVSNKQFRDRLSELPNPDVVADVVQALCMMRSEKPRAVARAARVLCTLLTMSPEHKRVSYSARLLPLLHKRMQEEVENAPTVALIEFAYIPSPVLPRIFERLCRSRRSVDYSAIGKVLGIACFFAHQPEQAVEELFRFVNLQDCVMLLQYNLIGTGPVNDPVVAAILKGLATTHSHIVTNPKPPVTTADLEWFVKSAEYYHTYQTRNLGNCEWCIDICRFCLRGFPSAPAIGEGPIEVRLINARKALNAAYSSHKSQ